MRVILALFALVLLNVPAFAGWHFSVRDTGYGRLCYASTEQNGIRLGFYGAPYGETFAFAQGASLPRNARSTWQINGHPWRQFTGMADSYDGLHIYSGIRAPFLKEVARGSRLDLYLHDVTLAGNAPLTGTLGISLRGSSRSIHAMLACQGWL